MERIEDQTPANMANHHLTISELAGRAGLSRSTLLYYDRLGLLCPKNRSGANYRLYDPADLDRLEQICLYRRMGVPLKEIAELLDDADEPRATEILQQRLRGLAREIASLTHQQRCIVALLKKKDLYEENEMIDKDRWVAIMRAAGLTDDDMHNWHIQFEKMEPDAHQEFLESLGIPKAEINDIRKRFRTA